MTEAPDDRFETAAESLGRRPGNSRFQNDVLFDGVDLKDREVLEIGAGDGATSLYLACTGASSVVSLEPEVAGSTGGSTSKFERARELIGADNVEIRGETFQEYDAAGRRFDVLVTITSINHLDEAACVRLHEDDAARRTYLELLSKLAGLAKPGASLVVCDCTRRNLFGDLHVRNPVAPTIEWEKHQHPRLWAELLEEVGFRAPRIRWLSFNSLRQPGRILLGNRAASYLFTSAFCLTMERG